MTLAADHPVVSPEELSARIIEPGDFVADRAAFVDVRLPGSEGKASYSFIGPGVSQNSRQTINITERHGFNVGAASMPHGTVNNAHLHFTAEVFICTRGEFRITVGEHAEQHLDIAAGDVLSVPTWLFRGFENVGPDDGWMFVVLGGDDTGGIIWAPSVLRRAAGTGLYLGRDQGVRDAHAGDAVDDVVEPLRPDQLDCVRTLTDAELAARRIRIADADWSDRALLSSVLPGHASAIAPVIGAGVSEHRDHVAPVVDDHGFSLEWITVEPGSTTGAHRLAGSQVLLLTAGRWEVAVNGGADRHAVAPADGSVVSIPRGAWREFANVGDDTAVACVVTEGDGANRLDWAAEVADAAAASGWALDAAGHVAPVELIGARRP